jgi:hypothetical protein
VSEDWASVAAEVEQAIRSIGDVSAPEGYPATLRKPPNGAPVQPWEPPTGSPTYHTVRVMVAERELRDINGTLIGQTKRTITISGAAGVVPSDDDRIAEGITAEQATAAGDDAVAWQEIAVVRPLAPAGVAVLYEIDLVT